MTIGNSALSPYDNQLPYQDNNSLLDENKSKVDDNAMNNLLEKESPVLAENHSKQVVYNSATKIMQETLKAGALTKNSRCITKEEFNELIKELKKNFIEYYNYKEMTEEQKLKMTSN